ALYGCVRRPTGNRTVVHIASVCKHAGRNDARAAFGLYWGCNSRHSIGWRIPGRQNDSRGILIGILCALESTPPTQQLCILTTSKYAIRAICYRAGVSYTEGWGCANGDLLENIVSIIQRRREQICFSWVEKPDSNPAHLDAKKLA
ncbi:hypothetical protein B0H17DRAFT_881211, partial [Mycena rosella]